MRQENRNKVLSSYKDEYATYSKPKKMLTNVPMIQDITSI